MEFHNLFVIWTKQAWLEIDDELSGIARSSNIHYDLFKLIKELA